MTIDYGKAIAQNERYRKNLMWQPGEIVYGATKVDSRFVDGVAARQAQQLKVDVDGVVGPSTYRAVLMEQAAYLMIALRGAATATRTDGTPVDRLELAGQLAVCEAVISWTRNITDTTSCYPQIQSMIATTAGLNWTWEVPYTGKFQWCGAAAANFWRHSISLQVRKDFFSSTYRLDRWAAYKPFESVPNPKPTTGPYRVVLELGPTSKVADVASFAGTGPRAGDILLVGDGIPAYGDHVTVVERFEPNTATLLPGFRTVEGNGVGLGPDGTSREGVVRAFRPLGLPPNASSSRYIARRLIRPAPSDIL